VRRVIGTLQADEQKDALENKLPKVDSVRIWNAALKAVEEKV